MEQVVLIIHLLIAIALVGVVLIQRSEGGGLGLGGGSGGMGPMMSVRGTANLLTRTTAILAACFVTTSLTLAILAGSDRTAPSILDAGGDSTIELTIPEEAEVDPLTQD